MFFVKTISDTSIECFKFNYTVLSTVFKYFTCFRRYFNKSCNSHVKNDRSTARLGLTSTLAAQYKNNMTRSKLLEKRVNLYNYK